MTNEDTTHPHPLGFWITAVDRLMKAEFTRAFADEGVTRRDWRLLNLVDGSVSNGQRPQGPKLRRLAERGWIARHGGTWALTDEGRAAKERLRGIVDGIHARITGTVEPDEFATMAASLEKIARELGWTEGMEIPRRERRGGRGHFGRRPGLTPGDAPHREDHHHECHGHGLHDRGFHSHGHHRHEHRFTPRQGRRGTDVHIHVHG